MSDETPDGLVQDLELRAEHAEEALYDLRKSLERLAREWEDVAKFEEQTPTTELECARARGMRSVVNALRSLLIRTEPRP